MNVKVKKNEAISILAFPLSTPKEKIFGTAIRDRKLINSICEYSKTLRGENIEVFERKENSIATEKGYFVALYEEDIRSREGGIDNPTPFKGKDGRMKVQIVKENGQISIEDLATLVAMAYAPNEKRYTKVWFRDNNPENVVDTNLIWISNFKYWLIRTLLRFGLKLKLK